MTRIPRGAVTLRWRRQRQEKSRRWPTLNLVALMDVFTILVFFFLVHSSVGAPGDRGELVDLPPSLATQTPRQTPIVTITPDRILLEGELVVTLDSATGAGEIRALREALASLRPAGSAAGEPGVALTIEGDKRIPFDLLNRVMRTAEEAGFGDLSLAVLQVSRGGG
jgi:biopolymer transport protein ExbD